MYSIIKMHPRVTLSFLLFLPILIVILSEAVFRDLFQEKIKIEQTTGKFFTFTSLEEHFT